jgi:hypothetical protein
MPSQLQLLLDLTAHQDNFVSVRFCEKQTIEAIAAELAAKNVTVMPIDGTSIRDEEGLYRAFAVALRMPRGWYGDEEYAPNPARHSPCDGREERKFAMQAHGGGPVWH